VIWDTGELVLIIKYYPDEMHVTKCLQIKAPVLILIKFDKSEVIMGNAEDYGNYNLLIIKAGYISEDIEHYFKVTTKDDGVEWIYICPSNYKGIKSRYKRGSRFFSDGMKIIEDVLNTLKIPSRISIRNKYLGR
jgi:hypothetical protein